MDISTQCIHGNNENPDETGAVSFPIYQSATFAHHSVGNSTGYDYSRLQNPTREQLEKIMTTLENGVDAMAFSTGMAAISAVMELFTPGDSIIVSDDLYGGTHRLFEKICTKNGLIFDAVNTSDISIIEKSITSKTKAIFIETPTNPMMKVTDISAVSQIAKKHNLLLIVDNTFLTPYFQKPILLGADIVVHSGTKYLCGHNDTLAGFAVVASQDLSDKLRVIYKTIGSCLSPFDSWLLIRGIKTLAVRLDKQQKNAVIISQWLCSKSKVKKVYYTGLKSHPSYDVTMKQSSGFGGMISFEVDSEKTARQILERVKLILFAESLGGVETLITYPMLQTHADVPKDLLDEQGVNEKLLRLSVGIEDVNDIISDLAQAMGEDVSSRNNFDEIIDRKNTNSLKYDFAKHRNMPEDALPLWVADMDFKTPPQVINALVKTSEHGIFGYTDVNDYYYNAIINWYKNNFNWNIEQSWIIKAPGVVFALAHAVKAYTNEGDSVMIQQPVYYPFAEVVTSNKRKLVNNSLVYNDVKYGIDFEDFENKIIQNDVKLFLLCSPHNPVGRVWSKDELIRLGDICIKHNVIVVADEIHADFVYEGYEHLVFSNIKAEFADITITCTAPSKTFNLAGLQVSNIIIPNNGLRSKFVHEVRRSGYSQLNTLGLTACQAAYENGREWLDKLKAYLAGNLDFIETYLKANIPQIKLVKPEGTYLLWLDFKSLGLPQKKLEDIIANNAKLWLDSGTMFGKEGEGFMRINISCPKTTLERAFNQLKLAMENN